MAQKAFFQPWFDACGYLRGINGKKVLVVGASFYCNQDGKRRERCPYYDDCTIKRNTRNYDLCCPYNHGQPLHDLPSNDLSENAPAHKNFFNLFKDFLQESEMNFDDFCKMIAFTNYVQHELGYRTKTKPSDCRKEYLAMFEDVLMSLPQIPDVIIIWGCVIDKPIKCNKNSELFPKFDNTCKSKDSYCFEWKNYAGKDIVFLSFYHPCSNRWFCNTKEWNRMLELLKNVLVK